MATTSAGARLSERHRQTQNAIAAGFLARFFAVWGLLDPTRLDATAPRWISTVLPLLRAARQDSADAATDYYRRFRDLELPDADPVTIAPEYVGGIPDLDDLVEQLRNVRNRPSVGDVRGVFDTVVEAPQPRDRLVKPRIDWSAWDEAAEKSLRVTGVGGQKTRTGNGLRWRDAQDAAVVDAVGAATRHVRQGGRQVLNDLIAADRTALGWVRVLGPAPCYFCAMLATRGIVYKGRVASRVRGPYSQRSFARSDPRFQGPGTVKVHDHCACTLEPVYAETTEWPDGARELAELWARVTDGLSGRDAINAFRRALEAQRAGRAPGQARPRRAA